MDGALRAARQAEPERQPGWSPEFAGVVRAYAPDVAAGAAVFFAVALMAGRIWRFPFDDEIYTLATIARNSAFRLAFVYPGRVDVHPPLSYLLFDALRHLGASDAGMRLVSLAMMAVALALFHFLTLTLAVRRGPIAPSSRLIGVLLFGLCPLAVSLGDALRWYPLLALLIALFVTLYLAGNEAARVGSAVALGLACSTNFLAGLVAVAVAVHRYVLQRRRVTKFDLSFWAITALFGSLGIDTALLLLFGRWRRVGGQLGTGLLRSTLTDVLGFFGGTVLGVGQAWIVAPVAAIAALAARAAINRKRPGQPEHLLLLMLGAAALTVIPGFDKPRSFLYLAPVLPLLLTLFLDREVRAGRLNRVLVLTALLLAEHVAVSANIAHNTHPFKRETVAPYGEVLEFIDANASGRVLVVSTDAVVPWVLSARGNPSLCASQLFRERNCFEPAQRYDSIFVVVGSSDVPMSAQALRQRNDRVAAVVAGRPKIATLHAGRDDDAALKSRLTGVPLDRTILTVDLYR